MGGAADSTGLPGAIPTRAAPLGTGQAFGDRYNIIRLLGSGGMGAVYHAWDAELGVSVALKVIRPEVSADPRSARDLERRFKRELLLARQVTHKNVVRIHDLGEFNGIKYITMPFVEGADLATILAREGKQPIARVLRIARQVISGLQAAHDAGIVHRDLKPANIMIDEEDDEALIMDFGIARSLGPTGGGTVLGGVVGTLEYMAPEQARAEQVDQRADLYAFGLIIYDLLAGRRRSSGGDSAVAELMARMQQPPPAIRQIEPAVPEAVERLISRCLEPDREVRYQKAAEIAGDLDLLDVEGHPRVPGHEPHAATRTVAVPIAVQVPRRPAILSGKTPWIAAAALLFVAIAVVAWTTLLPRFRQPPAPSAAAPVSLAILPFRNASGDQTLDWLGPSLAEMLRSDIGQSASLRTISSDRLHQILRDLQISADSAFDPPTLRRLAEVGSADTVVWGQYLRFGQEIRIDVTLEDVKRQRSIPLKAEAPTQQALFAAVNGLAQSIRENLSLSSDIIAELKTTSFKPSTQSLEALRFYNEGLQLARLGKHSEALKKFEASTRQDSEFALAYAKLGRTYANLGYDTDAERQSRRAVGFSERLPPRERYLILADHARIVHDSQKALESYENLVKVSPDDPDAHFELAGVYEAQGAFDKARQHYAKVLQHDSKYVGALLAAGRVEVRSGNPQGSLDYLNRALGLAIQVENDEERANILHTIGFAYRTLRRPSDALRYYQEALDIRRRIKEKRGIAVTLGEIALVHKQLSKPELALASHSEALQLQREIGDKRGMGTTLINLGVFYDDRGKYDEALQLYKESLLIQREVGNQDFEALCLNNIGNIYLSRAQYEDALTYFERTLQLREKLKHSGDIALTLHNLAETLTNMGRYDEASGHYLRALEITRGSGDKQGVAIESYSLGTLFEYQGRYGAAINAREEALKTFRELKDRGFWMSEILSGYGNTLSLVGREQEAEKHLAEAMTIARELQNSVLIAQISNFQGDRAFYRGDMKTARALFEQALKTATSRTTDRRLVLISRFNVAKLSVQEGPPQVAIGALKRVIDDSESIGLKYFSVQSSMYLGEALLKTKSYAQARQELDRVIASGEKLGLRVILARGHYLLSTALRLTGSEEEAIRHLEQARRILDEIRKESRSDVLVKRDDLRPILAEAR